MPRTPTRGGTPPFIIPTKLLADFLEPHIQELEHRMTSSNDDDNPLGSGAIKQIALRASQFVDDLNVEAALRRLYSIRYGEGQRTHTELADAFLMAIGIHIEDTSLPTLPGTYAGAREMVDVWAPNLDDLERERLSERLYRFSNGFLSGLYDIPTRKQRAEARAEAARELVAA